MDISKALVAKSDQLNASDLTGRAHRRHHQERPRRLTQPSRSLWTSWHGRPAVEAVQGDAPRHRTQLGHRNGRVDWAAREARQQPGSDLRGRSRSAASKSSQCPTLTRPFTIPVRISQKKVKQHHVEVLAEPQTEPWRAQWQAITNALTAAGYEGDGPAILATAGQVIGTTWDHPNKISPEDAQKILAAVREDNHQEPTQ